MLILCPSGGLNDIALIGRTFLVGNHLAAALPTHDLSTGLHQLADRGQSTDSRIKMGFITALGFAYGEILTASYTQKFRDGSW